MVWSLICICRRYSISQSTLIVLGSTARDGGLRVQAPASPSALSSTRALRLDESAFASQGRAVKSCGPSGAGLGVFWEINSSSASRRTRGERVLRPTTAVAQSDAAVETPTSQRVGGAGPVITATVRAVQAAWLLVGGVRGMRADLHEFARLVVYLPRGVVDAEVLVEEPFELEADGVAVVALVYEHMRRE